MAAPTYYQFSTNAVISTGGFADTSVYPEALVTELLAQAEGLHSSPFWLSSTPAAQDRQYQAILYWVAHKLQLMRAWGVVGADGSAGAVGGMALGVPTSLTSSQGSQSVSFGRGGLDNTSKDPDAEFTATAWGQLYLNLKRGGAYLLGTVI